MNDDIQQMLDQVRQRYPWAPPTIVQILFKNLGYVYDEQDRPRLGFISQDVKDLVSFIEVVIHEREAAYQKLGVVPGKIAGKILSSKEV